MANSALQGYTWKIPKELHNHLQKTMNAYKGDKNVEGYKRLETLLNEPNVSYEQLKRIKNFFDTHTTAGVKSVNHRKQDTQFILNGGLMMRDWVNKTLSIARDNVGNIKDIKKNSGTAIDNTHIKTHDKDGITTNSVKPHSISDIKIKKESYRDIYNTKEIRMMESLIKIFDKNKELWQTDN